MQERITIFLSSRVRPELSWSTWPEIAGKTLENDGAWFHWNQHGSEQAQFHGRKQLCQN